MKPKPPPPRPLLPKAEPASSSASPTLDGSSSSRQHMSKRRCISSACMPCRRRKSKCDGAQPSCSACISVYSSPCYYDIDSDHRRKGALKRDIAQLTEEKEAQTIILDAIRNGSESDVDDIVQYIRANPDDSFQALAEEVQKMGQQSTKVTRKLEPHSLESTLADYSGNPRKGEQIQHYGHTSNLALIGGDHSLPRRAMEQCGSWTTVTSDNELIRHLMDLYFMWSHCFYILFSQEVFFHGMDNKKLKYCTPLLVNAVLALGCTWSDRPEARADPNNPDTLGDHFFAEAKRLLSLEEEARLTTVQALGVMSLFEGQKNRDSAGWRYVGQMMSLGIEMGLHLSNSAQAQSSMTPTETEARRITFWGCFTLDTLWSFCIGRISALPRAAIRLEKPALSPTLNGESWAPGEDLNAPLSDATHEHRSIAYNMLLQLSLFTEILADIVHMFYAPRDRITSRRLQHHHEQYLSWFRKLPDCLLLKSDRPSLPQVITLHMYYHNCILHLFRPFLKVSFVQDSKSPRQICSEAADAVSRLAALYRLQYATRPTIFIQAHCVMSAAIIHLVNLSDNKLSQPVNDRMIVDLADSIRDLSAMHRIFPVVERYMKAICSLIYRWLPAIPPPIRQAMIDSEMPSSCNSNPAMAVRAVTNDPLIPLPISTLKSSSNSNFNPRPPNTFIAPRKHSAPELVSLLQPDTIANTTMLDANPSTQTQHQFFWTPFPDHVEGLPLPLPSSERNQPMDIGNMLDSGVDATWAQMNRDGFTMGHGLDVDGGGLRVGAGARGRLGEAGFWDWDAMA